MDIGDRIFDKMKMFMDYSTRKQKVITSNLANVETPGYKAKDLDFKDYLRSETETSSTMKVADPSHLKGIPKLNRIDTKTREDQDSMGLDGNNVDLEKEMTHMAQNVLKFSVVSRLFTQKLYMVRSSIKEGKG
jgi:flagellar basal-body rod protein FlgB